MKRKKWIFLVFILISFTQICFIPIGWSQETTPQKTEGPKPNPFFQWQSTRLVYMPYGWGFLIDPKNQMTLTLEHASSYSIGDIFLFLDATYYYESKELSDSKNWYGEIVPRLSLGKIFKKDYSFWIFKDVLLAGGFEQGQDGDVSGAALLGIGFDLFTPDDLSISGWRPFWQFIQLNIFARAETYPNPPVQGFSAIQVTMSGGAEFEFGKSRWLIDGFFDWVLGNGPENMSFHIQPQVKYDLGNNQGVPGRYYIGFEFDWWINKYQIVSTPEFDTNQFATSILLKYYF